MARSIWSGSLSFGLVNVPVGLFSATQEHEVHFHQFEEGTSSRIRYKRVNEDTGDEVAYDDIVKGAEVDEGEYVMLTQEELESVEPGKSRTIDISDFVDAAEIDPIHFQRSYYLAPEVRDPRKELDNLPRRAPARGKDVQMAVDLIDALTTRWDPKNYRDTYTDRVQELVEAKKKDRVVVTEPDSAAAGDKVVDLLTALQASLDESKAHRPGNARSVEKLRTRAREAGEVDLDELGKKELDALAKELDVTGRSRMTAAELRRAIEKARTRSSGGHGGRRAG